MQEAIPVFMYHSIAMAIDRWVFGFLSLDPAVFEDQLETLARGGYRTIFLSDLYDYLSGRRELPPRSIVLTFDDGYLDNWVFAYPLLRKHGLKGTIFVSTDFIDPRDLMRPTLEDVWRGAVRREALRYSGFLSVPEMKAMLASGVIDIQGHCKTHTWYFTGDEIVDFHHPGDSYPWLAWNARPERKSFYLDEDQSQLVPFGSPVYTYARSLVARRYFPDDSVQQHLVQWVGANGGIALFHRPHWREQLRRETERVCPGAGGRHETDEARLERLREEIMGSKQDLENILNKPVDFLCWPGGAYDKAAVAVAEEAGFLACVLDDKTVSARRNVPGEDPRWIRRTSAAMWWHCRGRRICPIDGRFLTLLADDYRGAAFASSRLKMYKIRRLLLRYLRQTARHSKETRR